MLPNPAAIGHVTTDSDQVILDVDDAYVEIVGRDRRNLIGQRALSFTHGEDLTRNQPMLDLLATNGAAFAIHKRYFRGDQSVIWVENHVSKVKRMHGAPLLQATCKPIEQPVSLDRLASNHRAIRQLSDALLASKQLFEADIANGPAVEALIWLYRAELEGNTLTIKDLAERSRLPIRVMQRWISLLQDRALIEHEGARSSQAAALRISPAAERAFDDMLGRIHAHID